MATGIRLRIMRLLVAINLVILSRLSQYSANAAAGGDYPFLKNASAAPPVATDFDYIIVGGGTAGCPLAATLSLNYSVLLLERGNTPYGNPDIESAANFGKLISNIQGNTWFSPVQSFQSQDGVFNRRARVLGGGSSINAGFYSRASDDYVSRAGWDAGMVASAYEWVESVVAFFPRLQQWQTAVRDALLEVGVGPDNGRTYKHASGTKVGGSIFDEAGKRHTAADLLQFANPNNITVLLFANVHRILFAPPVPGSPPRAIGVVFSDVLGFQHQASLRQVEGSEVILAAGAIGSPHLLMTSGIGDADVLGPLGIPIVVNLTGVGKDMADNPANAIYVPSPNPVEVSLIETVGITNFGSFIETASGSQASLSQVGSLGIMAPWFRSEELVVKYAEALNNLPVRTQQILGQAGVILQKVDGPSSKGNLTLNQSNIEDNPLVQFNYFSEPEDLYTCIESTRMVKQILETEAMRNYTYTTLPETILNNAELVGNLIPTRLDVDTLSEWCRNTVITIWHYHGGCGVGTVVDNEHRIIGAVGIRVIDGSTFNSSPGTNPQATVMMLGRYMGLKIHQDRQRAVR
ncbi:protein HOTHEAD isoform X2 [Physcomitrium patens]|uniref:protein HOTHEAD isoform X2 n=1 Tax=Physcomitrium patens TaxID=3218 RepID=UPI000D178D93|nr:protein HOTHEAD-like isoform X2 [Physcomitrium patens]XP_024384221.1 protein HOTHEAD-like isoform X2 [Physcomitrium patens]|eukprot:XP_024384220.1 protein HOTHEAD-like isoform X2 [Physcomitrella patens]